MTDDHRAFFAIRQSNHTAETTYISPVPFILVEVQSSQHVLFLPMEVLPVFRPWDIQRSGQFGGITEPSSKLSMFHVY